MFHSTVTLEIDERLSAAETSTREPVQSGSISAGDEHQCSLLPDNWPKIDGDLAHLLSVVVFNFQFPVLRIRLQKECAAGAGPATIRERVLLLATRASDDSLQIRFVSKSFAPVGTCKRFEPALPASFGNQLGKFAGNSTDECSHTAD